MQKAAHHTENGASGPHTSARGSVWDQKEMYTGLNPPEPKSSGRGTRNVIKVKNTSKRGKGWVSIKGRSLGKDGSPLSVFF